ncbi:MAG: ABC transporter permease [Chloroflexota bacterium]|nr:ABC transporter permease [Chloroflexota bacterium]
MSPNLSRYVLRRLLQAVPLLLGVLVVNFVLIHLAPGDPIYLLAGEGGDPAYFAAMRAKYGLDQPLPTQLALYLLGAVRGDFGYSFAYARPVFEVILARLPPTLLLMGVSLALSTFVGIFLGLIAGRTAWPVLDRAVMAGTLIGYGMPAFWLGQLLVLLFAVRLGWFPIQGMVDARHDYQGVARVADILRHLVLPATTLSLLHLALVTRLTRTGLREELTKDYARTARAKGLSSAQVANRHALRNALLPVVTVVGNDIGTLFSGAVLTEIIFAWPGLGRLLYDATLNRDYPLLMGIFLLVGTSVIVANIVTDVAYTFFDPRVTYS